MSIPPHRREQHESNRRSWNVATAAHNSHKRDQAAFLRAGGSTLFPEEIELLGNITGQRLAHLQCNAGQDSLSLARLGADITGVDISDEAIDFAKRLSNDSGIPARFERADVYDWLEAARDSGEQFDIVFCSYGAICWLSDLDRWAAGIRHILKPDGRFVCVDFHPLSMVYDENFEPAYPYLGDGTPLKWDDGITDYVAAAGGALSPSGHETGVTEYNNPHASFEYQWHIAAILSALIGAKLRIEQFHEYPYSNGAQLFDNMREEAGRRMYPPENAPRVPLMFSVAALAD